MIEHAGDGLTERGLSVALFLKYAALLAYGVWAAAVEIPTFVLLGGAGFAFTWAALVAVFAALAAFGVGRTWQSGRHRLEKWSTALFILTFTSYSTALIIRAVNEQNWATAPLALIPVALCALPTIRYFGLVRREHKTEEGSA